MLKSLRSLLLLPVLAALCGLPSPVSAAPADGAAQTAAPDAALSGPLTLDARGSFFLGGESAAMTFVELGSQRPEDTVTVNQMYVEYMVPHGLKKTPLVLVHGAGLSGSCYDTTPDGRMGWYEYFVRRGFPTYVVDQVGRGRSGFNQALFNNVGAGLADPASLPKIRRMGDLHAAWINFRFGPEKDVPYPDSQFPVEAAAELSRMGIPDLALSLPSPNPNYATLGNLAAKLDGAVLVGHSQSGHYPLESALLKPESVKAMVLVEPGTCLRKELTDRQIGTLAQIPLLVVYGDHLEGSTESAGTTWQQRFDDCTAVVERINRAGGRAKLLYPPSMGIHGNSHMMMQDRNNLQIADFLIEWIDQNVQHAR
ncbi:MAG: alpha/beta fold hydrolase [Desulfovibrionaceae bacterium]|nr:alpha/beta fold hydrolase [Desulfovibrionaceae bacterium]